MGWQRCFDDPISFPDGTNLSTLRQAIEYLVKTVPKAERDMPQVLTAAEMLTNAAEKPDIAWIPALPFSMLLRRFRLLD